MAAPRAWIFQARPQSRDLMAALQYDDDLTWLVARYGKTIAPDDRVYYWQSGRDAGIVGMGRVTEVGDRQEDGRRVVRTAHELMLFASLSRNDLRADDVLHDLTVLRQPRGTVFSLTAEQDAVLKARAGQVQAPIVIMLPADRRSLRARTLRLDPTADAAIVARVWLAHERGDEIIVVFVEEAAVPGRAYNAVNVRKDDEAVVLTLRRAKRYDRSWSTLSRAKEADGTHLFPYDFDRSDAGDPIQRAAAEHIDADQVYHAPALFILTADDLLPDLVLPESVTAHVTAAVRSGRHIVLMGVPGTGKTTLAHAVVKAAVRAGLCAGPLVATATADWTTFDTVGGLVPGAGGALRLMEGAIPRALRENRWVILDELNRADIDKALGPLLTVLAGTAVDLTIQDESGTPVRIEPRAGAAGLEHSSRARTYIAGSDWRIVATMNTLDRAALFTFSLAFARRFAFILIPPLDARTLHDLLAERVPLSEAASALLDVVAAASPRSLGPAVLLDAAGYIAARGQDPLALAEALGSFILPQMEGVVPRDLHELLGAVRPFLSAEGATLLEQYVAALFPA